MQARKQDDHYQLQTNKTTISYRSIEVDSQLGIPIQPTTHTHKSEISTRNPLIRFVYIKFQSGMIEKKSIVLYQRKKKKLCLIFNMHTGTLEI